MIIYKATNKINGKCYVGQTRRSLEDRKSSHLKNAKSGMNTHFYQALRKYGEENFEWEVLCTAISKKQLNELETFYIKKFDSIKHGYNMVDGGDNNIMDIASVKAKHDAIMQSEEVRKRISDSMKKYRQEHPFTEEHRRKLSEKAMGNQHFLGHKHSEEAKRKMSKRRESYYPKYKNGDTCDTQVRKSYKHVSFKHSSKVYVRKEITNKKVSEGRSAFDSRSVACYCIDEYGQEHHFYSYLDAGKWWYENYKQFPYSSCTYQRKIKQSIKLGYVVYMDLHKVDHKFDFPKWYEGGEHKFNEKIKDTK